MYVLLMKAFIFSWVQEFGFVNFSSQLKRNSLGAFGAVGEERGVGGRGYDLCPKSRARHARASSSIFCLEALVTLYLWFQF